MDMDEASNDICGDDFDEGLGQLALSENDVLALRLAPLSIAFVAIGLLFLTLFFMRPENERFLYAVDSVMAALAAGSLCYCAWRRAHAPQKHASRQEFIGATAVACLAGVAFGSVSIALYDGSDAQARLLIAFAIMGGMGNAMTLSFAPALLLAYLLPIVAQAVFALLVSGADLDIFLAILVICYAQFIVVASNYIAAIVRSGMKAQRRLEREKAQVQILIDDFEESADDWLWETDDALRLRDVRARLSAVVGRNAASLNGLPIAALFAPDGADGRAAADMIAGAIAARQPFRDILLPVAFKEDRQWWRVTGKPMFAGKRFVGYRGVGADVSIKKRAEDRLSFLLRHDALTDLSNRQHFQQRVARAAAELCAGGPPFAGTVRRYRSIQACQRHAWPSCWRPAAQGCRRTFEGVASAQNFSGAPGGRRVRGPYRRPGDRRARRAV